MTAHLTDATHRGADVNLRQMKRQHDAFTTRRLRLQRLAQEFSEMMHAQAALDDDWDGDDTPRDSTCRACNSTGRDKWNDGLTDCEACGGEGYEWWQ